MKACIYLFKKSGKSKILLSSDLCDAFQMIHQISVMRKICFVGPCAFSWCVCVIKTKYEFKMEWLFKFILIETLSLHQNKSFNTALSGPALSD